MKPKPTPPKRPKVSKLPDLYRGYVIEFDTTGQRWYAHPKDHPTYELFDCGFNSRQEIIDTINEMMDGFD